MTIQPQMESTPVTVAPPTPSPETAKDERRRGAELDMAHKAYDRAKGHFHSRVGRSWCTMCHGRGWSGPERSARAPIVLSAAYDDVEEAKCSHLWAQEVIEYERRKDCIEEALLHLGDDVPESELPAPASEPLPCKHCGGAGGVICIAVKPARQRKRKGIAADYEMVPNASHHVRVLEDFDSDSTPQENWELVDSDDSERLAPLPRSYAGVVQGRS